MSLGELLFLGRLQRFIIIKIKNQININKGLSTNKSKHSKGMYLYIYLNDFSRIFKIRKAVG